jgi:hypothetical protein
MRRIELTSSTHDPAAVISSFRQASPLHTPEPEQSAVDGENDHSDVWRAAVEDDENGLTVLPLRPCPG